ncbi:unnamed protein product [Paramecium pentaurelia]|uniref:Cytochrome P450 n=1 Tax=Paramecium pentaurelia TaxID=43138 RepID=A0A8S1U032_9CILI|nr:unnamed protein product [Paramecium pentaurelia]
MLSHLLLGSFVLFIYVFVLKPLCSMFKLKMQFGQDCKMSYHFLGGEIWKRLNEMKITHDIFKYEQEQYKRHPYKIFVSNFLWKIRIQVTDPEYYKVMLHNHQYYEKVNVINDNNLMKKGLIFEMNGHWKTQRTLLAGQFEFLKLKNRLPMINQVSLEMISELQCQNNILEVLELITGEIVIKSFFGDTAKKITIFEKDIQVVIAELLNDMGEIRLKSKYVYVKRLILGTMACNFFPTENEKKIQQRIDLVKFEITKLIKNRLIEIQSSTQQSQGNSKSNLFIDVLLQDYIDNYHSKSESQAIDEILQQFITLLFAGTDTTAVLCYHCLYFFALYPEAQQEIREEVLSVCTEEHILDDKFKQLNKLSAFINEVLRLRNPAAKLILRNSIQTHQVKDLKIQKNWNVIINPLLQSVSEQHFINPDDFDYKRWLTPEPILNNDNFIYLPFSAGPRNCIGQHMALMEAKIILSQILKQFIIQPNEHVIPKWTLRFVYQLQPSNCVRLIKNLRQQ